MKKVICRYEDDKDEGEWFLYTGSGGRDLSGNKRVNKVQSFDQTFDKMNKALLLSCEKGLPVRVVRSHKVRGCAKIILIVVSEKVETFPLYAFCPFHAVNLHSIFK